MTSPAPGGRAQHGVLRPFAAPDRAAVAEVCVRTAAAGGDARGLYSDDLLMPDVYALPYVTLEPELAWVVVQPHDGAPLDPADEVLRVDDGVLVGYVVSAADTAAFVERWRHEWTQQFLARHPEPVPPRADGPAYTEAELWRAGVDPDRMLDVGPDVLAAYPAHLHIDLLPRAQRQGWGRRMIATLREALARRGVPGVHLGYAAENTDAGAFYARLGFRPLPGSTEHLPLVGLPTGA